MPYFIQWQFNLVSVAYHFEKKITQLFFTILVTGAVKDHVQRRPVLLPRSQQPLRDHGVQDPSRAGATAERAHVS